MSNRLKRYILALLLLGSSAVNPTNRLFAQQAEQSVRLHHEGIKRSTHYLSYGGLLLHDSYLSPLNYGGWSLGYTYDVATPQAKQWLWHPTWSVNLGSTLNPGQNGRIYQLQLRGDLSYQKRWSLSPWGYIALGPNLSLGAGTLYSTRNGNNPATGKVDLSLGFALDYSFRLPSERFPLAFRLGLRTDILGGRFSQGFGESYYELYYVSKALDKRIYLSHLGNAQTLRTLLAVDIPLIDIATCSVGYQLDLSHWMLNHLQNNQIRQSFLLGITTYLYQLSKRSDLQQFPDKLTF